MENGNIENTNDTEKLERMKRDLTLLFKRCTDGKALSKSMKTVFDRIYSSFNFILATKQPLNKLIMLRIHRDLLVTCEQMKTVESKLSVIENEIRNLKAVIDSTDENIEDIFLRSKVKIENIIMEVAVEMNESGDRLQVILAAVRSVE